MTTAPHGGWPPRLVLVADGFTAPGVGARVVRAVEAGVRWVQLRDHEAPPDRFEEAARALAARLCRVAPGLLLSVNARPGVAQALGASVHTGRRGPSIAEVRLALGPLALVGYSAHDEEEARRAASQGASYLFFSPVYRTSSKPGQEGTGLEALRAVCEAVHPVPVLALGGITPARVAACREAGAHGVAVLSGILAAQDPGEAARRYLDPAGA